jgi:hypothetical protein
LAGRPTKFEPAVTETILQSIRDGNPRSVAAAAAGVGKSTLMAWLALGRGNGPADEAFRVFLDDVKRADAEAVAAFVAVIRQAAPASWQAAAWWLERHYPDQFGSQRREIAELKKQLKELEAAIRGHAPPTPPATSRGGLAG